MALGAAYGLLARTAAGHDHGKALLGDAFVVMSLAFLFVVPAVVGVITVSAAERPSRTYRVFAPWVPVLLSVVAAVVIGWEGMICVFLGLPLILLGASLGGVVGGLVTDRRWDVRAAFLHRRG